MVIKVKKAFNKVYMYFQNTKEPYKWEWVILGLLILLPFISCFYGDTNSILLYEVDFFGSIFKGDGVLSYYDYVMNRMDTTGIGNYATYDFPMYIVLGIWGAPLWFLAGAKGVNPLSSIVFKIYGKSIFLVALAITTVIIYLICKELKISKENSMWGAFIYASSLMIYVAICLNGQTDILGMVFILLGLLMFIKDKRMLFLLFFAIAIPFKQYALFIFVPLLLLKEKRIRYIILKTIAALSILAGSNLLFDSSSPSIQIKKSFELDMFNRLTAMRLPLLNGSVPIIVVLLLVVCVFCFLKKIDDREEMNKYSIFIPLLVMGIIFISFESSSYWYVHLVPYLAIMLVYNSGNLKHCLLFETVGMMSLVLANYASRPWSFDIYAYNNMFLGKVFGDYNALETPFLLGDFCQKSGIVKYCGTLFGVYVVLLFTTIYLCRPSNIKTEQMNAPIRGYSMVRLFLNTLIAYIPGGLYLYNVYLAGKL